MPSVVTSRSLTAMLRTVSRLCLVAGRELPLLLSSTCPVYVQYLSSGLLNMYCTNTAHLLHKIRSKSLANLWDTEDAIIFYEIVQAEEHF